MIEWLKRFLGIESSKEVKSSKEVVMHLDPERVKDNETIRALAQQLRSREAQLADLLAEKHEEKEKFKSQDKEQETIKRLRSQERELREKNIGNMISLYSIFKNMNSKKQIKDSSDDRLKVIELTDREGKEVIGYFGDISIIDNDKMALLDIYNNVICIGREINQLIYKPESLINYIKRRQIPIPKIFGEDGNLRYVPDLENLEIPERHYDYDHNEQFETIESLKKVKYQLEQKNESIKKLKNEVERQEKVNINLISQLDDYKRTNKKLDIIADNSKTQLSEIMDKYAQMEVRIGDLYKEITTLTETKTVLETMIVKLEEINGKMLNRFEEMGINTKAEETLNAMQQILDWSHAQARSLMTKAGEIEKKREEPIQPGQPIK